MQEHQNVGLAEPIGGNAMLSHAELLGRLAAQERVIARQAEELESQRSTFEQASQAARMGLWQCRLPDEVLTWSEGVYALFDLPLGARLRRSAIVAQYAPESSEELEEKRSHAIEQRSGFSMDARIITTENQTRWIRITASVECALGEPVRLFGMKQDITEARLLLDRKRYLADFDVMTGIANRYRFEECLADLRSRDQLGALMLVDLDGFKAINDTHGHAVGDLCLRESATRLAAACQGGAHLVARIGGDEFAVVFDHSVPFCSVSDAARCILKYLSEPVTIDGRDLKLSASIGVATRSGGLGADPFLEADQALYAAKHAGKNTFRIAKPGHPDRDAAGQHAAA